MKEIHDIVDAYDKVDKGRVMLALATVIDIQGSSYRRTGARMLIQDNGVWTGGISGGCIEGNALKKANMAIIENKARIVTYDTENDDESQIGVSLGCNGIISVLITPIDSQSANNPVELLRKTIGKRTPTILTTVIESNIEKVPTGIVFMEENATVYFSDTLVNQYLMYAKSVYESGKSAIFSLEGLRLFIEYIPPAIHLVIAGGNYDVLPLLQLSSKLNWQSTLVYNPARLARGANELANEVIESMDGIIPDPYTVVVLMSHDYKADLDNLAKVLTMNLPYIGLLGPANRRKDMVAELQKNGIDVDESKLYGPAGLDIGAAQPEEIATSIISEIIAVLRGRHGGNLKERQAPIYDRST